MISSVKTVTMTSLIVDASVAVKWLVPEPGASHAEALLTSTDKLLAPDLVVTEVANALWKRVVRGLAARNDVLGSLSDLMHLWAELVPTTRLVPQALALGTRHSHPVYDCCYLALCLERGFALVTADRRLARVADAVRVEVILHPS